MGVIQITMKTSVICLSIILCLGCLVLAKEEQDRQLSNLAINPLGTLLGLGGSGFSAGALASLAGSNPALAALFGSGLNGLTGTGPVVSGLAGAGASSLVSGGGSGLSDLLSGGKDGKGSKSNESNESNDSSDSDESNESNKSDESTEGKGKGGL